MNRPALPWRLLAAARAWKPALLIVGGHTMLAMALFATDGHEDPGGVFWVFASIGVWARALQLLSRSAPTGIEATAPYLWLFAISGPAVSVLLHRLKPPAIYAHGSQAPFIALDLAAVALIATYIVDIFGRRSLPRSVAVARRASLAILMLGVGGWVIRASPHPKINLFPVHQQAAEAMLAGKSIYEPGVIHAIETFQKKDVLDEYTYPPLGASLATIAYAIAGDYRWVNLVGQLLGALFIWLTARRARLEGASPRQVAWGELLAVALLFHPRAPFVLEQGWTESLVLPFLGGVVFFASMHWRTAAQLSLGLLVAMKQHLFWYLPFLGLLPEIGLVGVAVAGAAALATMAPFVLRSPAGFYRGVFAMLVNNPFRYDALSLPAEIVRLGFTMPTWVGFAAAVLPTPALLRIPRALTPLLLAACVSFGLFYVLGRQAFCNYYYLLDATALLAAASLVERKEDPVQVAPMEAVVEPTLEPLQLAQQRSPVE